MIDSLKIKFKEIFNTEPQDAFFAPGRVNLIGEHIDYNGGLVMPCAITPGTYLLTAPNNDGLFRFRSLNFKEEADLRLEEGYQKLNEEWYNYPLGVIDCFLKADKSLSGIDFLFNGDLPIGASLSSSASIEVVTAFALNELFDSGFSKLDLVKLAMKVENDFMGLSTGIMDQFAVTFGAANKALKLNCDTLEYDEVPVELGDHVLAIINSKR
jgi:galactokinase